MDTRHLSDSAATADLSATVRSTIGRLYRRFRSERVDGALGDTALEVLTYLHKHGPRTLTELSEMAQVAPASMTQSVNRLTSAGYAVRSPDPNDRRKVLFTATAAGAEVALANSAQRNAWLDAQLENFSPEDQRVIAHAFELLNRVAES
ncbi:MarR family transcriptional regulator [Subtercola vilae]